MGISRAEAEIVMGMLARGDHNHDIAAWFGENPGRVAEIKDGTMYGIVPAAPPAKLPPKGAVGPKAKQLRAYAIDALGALKKQGGPDVVLAIRELEDGIKKFDR